MITDFFSYSSTSKLFILKVLHQCIFATYVKWALKSYKAMVNDTISNALETIQLKTVAFDTEWETGISLGVSKVTLWVQRMNNIRDRAIEIVNHSLIYA